MFGFLKSRKDMIMKNELKFSKNIFVKVSYILIVLILLTSLILFFCPLKYHQSFEGNDIYYSAYNLMIPEYYWSMILSIIFGVVNIGFCIYLLVNKKTSLRLNVLNYSLFGICAIFIALTFVFAFVCSTNYVKSF